MKKVVLALCVLIIVGLVGACGVVASETYFQKASDRIFERPDDLDHRPVAIVLGARVMPDGTPSTALADRLHAALALYQTGRVQRILVSGDHGQTGYDEVHAMRGWLLEHGVSDEDIFMDHAGFRTYDTMHRAARIFGVEEAIICTQRYHLPRSIRLAEDAGINAVGFVADRHHYPHARANARREFVARQRAMLDILSPFARPKLLGPQIPIDSDARLTHDENTLVQN